MSMEPESFNPDRLVLARHRRGLTKVALAKAVELTSRRLAEFENEGVVPPAMTVERLASTLGFPVKFFYRDGGGAIDAARVSFRAATKMAASERDVALACSAIALEFSSWIASRFDLPEADIPELDPANPSRAARALRKGWGIGEGPAPNMVHLLESHGTRIFSLAADCARLDAFSFWESGEPFVILSTAKSAERRRWDAAHELAHLALHRTGGPQGRDGENQADAFAAEFLLPAEAFTAAANGLCSLVDVMEEKVVWGVSAMAFIRRAHQLGLITEWQYRSMMVEASAAGLRRAEDDIEPETSQVWAKVSQLLDEDEITLADIAADLSIPVAELRGLSFPALSVLRGSATTTRGARERLRAYR